MTVVASVQYRAISENATYAFYKLSDTRSQIQAYVYDGKVRLCKVLIAKERTGCSKFLIPYFLF